MKLRLILLVVGLSLLALLLLTRSRSSQGHYQDPLATNEFPLRFTDPIQPPVAQPPKQIAQAEVPKAIGRPPFKQAWEVAALNEGLSLVLTQQLLLYSKQPIRGKIYFDPSEYPAGFIPRVQGFEFVRSSPPHTGANFNGPDVLMHMTGWRDIVPGSNAWMGGYGGTPVANFSLSPRGVLGGISVGLDVSLGVTRTSNGFRTAVLMAIDP